MDFAALMESVKKEMQAKMDQRIKELRKAGPIPKIREFELVFENIVQGYGISPDVNDSLFDNPGGLKSLKEYTIEEIDGTSLNSNEIDLFHKFIGNLSKNVDFVSKSLELLEAAQQEDPIFLYDSVKAVLTKLLEARK